MKFIIDFYKSLDSLNLIIFWGIIIVIILLLIFSFILINKNKKLKQLVETKNKQEDLPIKKIEPEELNIEKYQNYEKIETNEEKEIVLPEIPKINKQEEQKPIEIEREFIAEEHIKKYNQDDFQLPTIKKTNDEEILKQNNNNNNNNIQKNISKEIEIPTKPYQRNVLREMSLSQTSPIGITKPINKQTQLIEEAKDLEESLNQPQERKEITRERNMIVNEEVKKELSKIDDLSNRKTEINYNNNRMERKTTIEKNTSKPTETKYERQYNKTNQNRELTHKEELYSKPTNANYSKDYVSNKSSQTTKTTYKEENNSQKKYDTTQTFNSETKESYTYDKNEYIPPQVRELLNITSINNKENNVKSTSEKYLEEVSRKLAEAEMPDEIERTDYELEQEENAIISYTELMEKKDSIQTIDEEEAIISIEELMNRNNQQPAPVPSEETKLYNITEEEANDNFLKELKQFRNDL